MVTRWRRGTLEFDQAPNTERFNVCRGAVSIDAFGADRHSGRLDSLLPTDFDKDRQMCERSHIEHESMTVVKREVRVMVKMFVKICFDSRDGLRIVDHATSHVRFPMAARAGGEP